MTLNDLVRHASNGFLDGRPVHRDCTQVLVFVFFHFPFAASRCRIKGVKLTFY